MQLRERILIRCISPRRYSKTILHHQSLWWRVFVSIPDAAACLSGHLSRLRPISHGMQGELHEILSPRPHLPSDLLALAHKEASFLQHKFVEREREPFNQISPLMDEFTRAGRRPFIWELLKSDRKPVWNDLNRFLLLQIVNRCIFAQSVRLFSPYAVCIT
jgi:hypothetical protein